MLVVMVVIAILAGIVLSVAGLVQNNAARARATAEIKGLSGGCEAYKTDNGSFPQDAAITDVLDPRAAGTPTAYEAASLFLYKQISGDLDANGRNDTNASTPEPKGYLADFFKPTILSVNAGSGVGAAGYVRFIKDPWGNSYGYSTKGAAAEQAFRQLILTNPAATRQPGQGYNPTFDLWSTGGKSVVPKPGQADDITPVWLKNW
jgi:type II secretory pathway pseudopilin PulG